MASCPYSQRVQGRNLSKSVRISIISIPGTPLPKYKHTCLSVIRNHGGINAGVVVKGRTYAYGGEIVPDFSAGPHCFFGDDVYRSSYGGSTEKC